MSRWIGAGLVVMVTLGCSRGPNYGPTGTISGKLTMDGEPLAEGTQLLFMQMDAGYAAFGATDADGNYEIIWIRDGARKREVPTGVYKVLIQPPAIGTEVELMTADQMLEGGDVAPAKPDFPSRYQQHSTSGLEYTVTEGPNTIDIDLDSA